MSTPDQRRLPSLNAVRSVDAAARHLRFTPAARDLTQSPGFEHCFMLIEATAAGMGLALLPQFFAGAELASGRLVQPYEKTLRTEQA